MKMISDKIQPLLFSLTMVIMLATMDLLKNGLQD
jgi:hypothetical protein